MPTLVTHIIPHLDDIAALWLLVRFEASGKTCRLKFVQTSPEGIRLAKGEIGVGVGRGKYDEHKGDKKESAVSLVWKDLKRRGRLPGGLRGAAVAELVEYVKRGDLGEFIGAPGPTFSVPEILRAMTKLDGEDSLSASLVGFRLLDAMLVLYEERINIDRAIRTGTKFLTRWGRGVAIEVDAVPGAISNRVAERGYALVVVRYPDSGFLHVRCTPGTRADMSRLSRRLMKMEPEARWYLHHSNKLLIQGDWVAPIQVRSKVGLKDLIAMIKEFYG